MSGRRPRNHRIGCPCLDCQFDRAYERSVYGAPRLMDAGRAYYRAARASRLNALSRALACAGLLAEADRAITAGGSWLDGHAAELRREAARIAFEDPCAPNGRVLR